MTLKRKITILIATGIAVILLFSITILPIIIRNKAVTELGKSTGRKVRMESVSINPFTLSVSLKGFMIEEKTGAPFVSIGEFKASIGMASLYKRALIIDEVTIDKPSISIARIAANSYSFSDIIDRLNQGPKKEKSAAFPFSINNITIKDGSLDFHDQAVNGGRNHTVRNLEIAIPFISSIPYLVEKYTEPKISAIVNGSPFSFSGKIKPLSKSLETSVRIDLKQLNLPELIAYLPLKLPVDLASGKLTIDANLNYLVCADKKPVLSINGQINLNDFVVTMKDGQPLVKLPSLAVTASRLEMFSKQFKFDNIALDGLELFVNRNSRGEWMYSRLLPPTKTATASKDAINNTKPSPVISPAISVASFSLNNASVHFRDALPKGGFSTTISALDVAVRHFSNEAGKTAEYELSMLLDNDADFSADGSFSIAPLSSTASVDLSGLRLQKGWPYFSRYLTAPVKGTLDLAGNLTFTGENGLNTENCGLTLNGLSTRYGEKEGFDLARLAISGVSFRQKENRLEIGDIRLSRGDISLSKGSDGSISMLTLLKKQTSSVKGGAKPVTSDSKSIHQTVSPLSYRLKHFQLEKLNLTFTDKSREEKPRFTLRNTTLNLTNLNGPKFTPAALRFSSTFGKDTPLTASGDITPLPFRYKGKISARRLPIRDFEDYFPDNLNVFIIGGYVDTAMNLDIALRDGKPFGSFKGSTGVRAFHSIDTIDEEDLLKWESLQFDEIKGSLEPFVLSIHEVALNNVYSRIIIRKDGSLNLQNLVENKGSSASQQSAVPPAPEKQVNTVSSPTAAKSPAIPASPAKRQISVGAITIQDGTLAFTDYHLPQTFSSTFFNLGGRVSGLSSEEARFADVDLRGNLESHSPLQITGKLNPLRDDLFVDLKISFRDIELSPVTPYSGTYLGYTVDKGKLFLDLRYLIDKKQLTSENRIFIDQFTFGKKVESKQATSLPVRLAIALLKDRKGEIHLDLPVTGRTDDPKFSIWGVVWQVVKNLIVKAATSPFALLSSMVGGGQDFSAVQFAIGSSTLAPAEEQKLGLLAKALSDRPGVKIEIKGFVDKEKDAEGYRQELLNRKLRNEKYLSLAKEQQNKEVPSPETVQVLPVEYSKYLKAVYKKEKFPKPRNVLGLVKDLPDDEMRKLIIASTVVGETELGTLAKERAVAVMGYLVKKGGLPPERLFQKLGNIHKAPEKENSSRSRVEFDAIVQ